VGKEALESLSQVKGRGNLIFLMDWDSAEKNSASISVLRAALDVQSASIIAPKKAWENMATYLRTWAPDKLARYDESWRFWEVAGSYYIAVPQSCYDQVKNLMAGIESPHCITQSVADLIDIGLGFQVSDMKPIKPFAPEPEGIWNSIKRCLSTRFGFHRKLLFFYPHYYFVKKRDVPHFLRGYLPTWNIFLFGHGNGEVIAQLPPDIWRYVLRFLDEQCAVKLFTYLTCYGGGRHLEIPYKSDEHYHYPIVCCCSGDFPAAFICSWLYETFVSLFQEQPNKLSAEHLGDIFSRCYPRESDDELSAKLACTVIPSVRWADADTFEVIKSSEASKTVYVADTFDIVRKRSADEPVVVDDKMLLLLNDPFIYDLEIKHRLPSIVGVYADINLFCIRKLTIDCSLEKLFKDGLFPFFVDGLAMFLENIGNGKCYLIHELVCNADDPEKIQTFTNVTVAAAHVRNKKQVDLIKTVTFEDSQGVVHSHYHILPKNLIEEGAMGDSIMHERKAHQYKNQFLKNYYKMASAMQKRLPKIFSEKYTKRPS